MKHFLLRFFLLFALHANAQELFFSKPAVFQNLPSIETYQVLQDKKGALWIATDAGLCKYDGNTLITYTKKDGISENVVLKAYEDRKGRLWFTTLAGYFFYYENDRFYEIAANEELKKLCSYYPISSFFVGENDTLFCATNRLPALLKIPPQNNYKNIIQIFEGFENCNRFFYTNKLSYSETIFNRAAVNADITIDSVAVNNNGKIIFIHYKLPHIANTDTRRGASDKDGNIFLGLGPELIILKKENGRMENHIVPAGIISIYKDQDNDLWVCTLNGGYLYKNSDMTSRPIHFLNSLTVCSISIDREGSIWAATKEKGIFKCNSKHVFLLNEKANYLQKDATRLNITCRSYKIISFFKNDSMYVDNSLSKHIQPEIEVTSSFIDSPYSYFNIGPKLHSRNVNDNHAFSFVGYIAADEIFKINKDTIYAISSKLLCIIANGKLVKQITDPFSIKYATQLKDKTILISSRNNSGIYEFKKDQFIPFLPQLPELKTRINCMKEDSAGNLWFATNEHGLYCYDKHHTFHSYNITTIPNKINSLAFDRSSNLWAAANHELLKINYSASLEKPFITIFTTDNGIPNFQLEKLMEFDGKIWCSTNENVFYFDTRKLHPNPVPPLVYIKNIFVNDQSYPAINDTLQLQHHQNNIQVQANVITYKNISKKKFLYKLIGYDDEWHISSTGEIQYTNLDHGRYQLVIYGLNNDGKKSESPAMVSFVIARPFWLTWWFIALMIILAGAVFFFSLKYWKNKIEMREHEKTEREKEKILLNQKITEFKMTALRAQMNPHFIFNAIGSIQNYILHNEITKSYEYLSKFALLIRNILNNSKDEYISLSKEIETLQLYIALEQTRFRPAFRFILDIDQTLDMEMEIPTMLIQPYIENSIWHGLMPKGNGILELTFKNQDTDMLVIIKDNGVGRKPFDPSKKTHISKGMSITEQRIQTLEVTNQKKFKAIIMDLKDDAGNSIGTEVQLIIPFDL